MPAQLAFAKLTTPATEATWSLAYNAGSLFATLALTLEPTGEKTAAELGKSVISNLEAEFFSLEEKSFEAIKTALSTALADIPKSATLSAAFAYNKDGFLYIYALGNAQIMLHRNDQTGILLKNTQAELSGGSGVLQTGDTLLLGTNSFFSALTSSQITEAFSLQHPSDMSENLHAHLTEKSTGTEVAMFLTYTGDTQQFEPRETSLPVSTPQPTEEIPEQKPSSHHFGSFFQKKDSVPDSPLSMDTEDTLPSRTQTFTRDENTSETTGDDSVRVTGSSLKSLSATFLRSKFLFIGLAFLVFFILIGLIYQTKQNEYKKQVHAIFTENYEAAKKDFEEGESLYTLNKALAHDDYQSAKDRLTSIEGKLKADSEEAKLLADLLEKVNARLDETGTVSTLTATEKTDKDSLLLATLAKKSPLAITEDATSLYLLNSSSVTKIDKSTNKETTVIKNDDDWDQAVAIALYLSNIYILDQQEGVLKYTPTSSGFVKTTYFKEGEKPTSTLTGMSIDSSIWLLSKDGKVLKFTKGSQDSFSLSGLETLPTNPSKLHTTIDGEILYVLDQQNSQILLFDKTGAFSSSLVAPELKNAIEFTVDEKTKTILFLSNKKIYQISLP